MQFDRGYILPYFVTDPENLTCDLENAHVLLDDWKHASLGPFIPLLESVVQQN
ncbi:MAG: hypothetical protein WBN04_07355 [Paracoccaceae bacterium]